MREGYQGICGPGGLESNGDQGALCEIPKYSIKTMFKIK